MANHSPQYIVVTGASKGIGRATALMLQSRGFHVFAGVRTLADGEALCKDAPERLTPIMLDVTKSDQIQAAVAQISAVVGDAGLAGLVNNAGVAVAAPLEFIPVDELRWQLEVNVTGQLAVTQPLIPLLRKAKGRLVNVSSIGGRIAGGTLGAYHASKFALEAITDTFRIELAPWGIEVIAIEPGNVATPIWETSSATFANILKKMSPKVHELYQDRLDKAQKFADNGVNGIPPTRVAEVIFDALTSARPRTRYTVGPDARIGDLIIRQLPDRVRDRFLNSR